MKIYVLVWGCVDYFIGITDVNTIKAMAMTKALATMEVGFTDVEVELDSLTVVNGIILNDYELAPFGMLFKRQKMLVNGARS